jgi:hypothetical protein
VSITSLTWSHLGLVPRSENLPGWATARTVRHVPHVCTPFWNCSGEVYSSDHEKQRGTDVLLIEQITIRIWGSYRGGYEEFYLLLYNVVWSFKSQSTFRKNISPLSLLATCFTLIYFLTYSSILNMELICSPETSVDFNGLCGLIFPKIEVFKSLQFRRMSVHINIVTYSDLAWLITMGSEFDDWIYWHFFIITVTYNSSPI